MDHRVFIHSKMIQLPYFGCIIRRPSSLETVLRKLERKRRRRQLETKCMDSVTVVMDVTMEDLKDQFGDRLS